MPFASRFEKYAHHIVRYIDALRDASEIDTLRDLRSSMHFSTSSRMVTRLPTGDVDALRIRGLNGAARAASPSAGPGLANSGF